MRCATRLLAALLPMLWACEVADGDLPPSYRHRDVPEEVLASPEARARGAMLFSRNCAHCHGEHGDGHGVRSSAFVKAPADLTLPAWQARATPRRIYFVLKEGVRGTPMPAWPGFSEAEVWDLVAFVLSLGQTIPERSKG